MIEISNQLQFAKKSLKDRYFIIDDTVFPKRGKFIENVSYIYDHSVGRSVLGFCIVSLGLFTGNGYYPLDFSYWVSKKRPEQSPMADNNDPRSISGRMNHEALNCTKLELALKMLERAVLQGLRAGYVLFDGWYAWPSFIWNIRKIRKNLHVICRLKDSKVLYEYKGRKYRLSALYQKVKKEFKKSQRTELFLKRVKVNMPGNDAPVIIVFAKGYNEPEASDIKGKKKQKTPNWVAFLRTDIHLHASTVIKKYTKRWACEVFFKESKQLLCLGKDASNNFQSQISATNISLIRYAMINYLNEKEQYVGFGNLFEELADESSTFTYAHRIWQFFKGLFEISISKIFELFEIEDDFQSFFDILNQSISRFAPFQGCETWVILFKGKVIFIDSVCFEIFDERDAIIKNKTAPINSVKDMTADSAMLRDKAAIRKENHNIPQSKSLVIFFCALRQLSIRNIDNKRSPIKPVTRMVSR